VSSAAAAALASGTEAIAEAGAGAVRGVVVKARETECAVEAGAGATALIAMLRRIVVERAAGGLLAAKAVEVEINAHRRPRPAAPRLLKDRLGRTPM